MCEATALTDQEIDELVERAKATCAEEPLPLEVVEHAPQKERKPNSHDKRRAREAWERDFWETTVRPKFETSAEWFCGDDKDGVRIAGAVILAGLICGCREYSVARLLGIPKKTLWPIAARLRAYDIWLPDGSVRSFGGAEEFSDLGLWLDAMVGAGILERLPDGETYQCVSASDAG